MKVIIILFLLMGANGLAMHNSIAKITKPSLSDQEDMSDTLSHSAYQEINRNVDQEKLLQLYQQRKIEANVV